jgi:hypothetical protein
LLQVTGTGEFFAVSSPFVESRRRSRFGDPLTC